MEAEEAANKADGSSNGRDGRWSVEMAEVGLGQSLAAEAAGRKENGQQAAHADFGFGSGFGFGAGSDNRQAHTGFGFGCGADSDSRRAHTSFLVSFGSGHGFGVGWGVRSGSSGGMD
jgi:hypothetical protein